MNLSRTSGFMSLLNALREMACHPASERYISDIDRYNATRILLAQYMDYATRDPELINSEFLRHELISIAFHVAADTRENLLCDERLTSIRNILEGHARYSPQA